MDNNSIWTRIMQDKYIKNNNFSISQKRLEIRICGKKLLIIENILGLV